MPTVSEDTVSVLIERLATDSIRMDTMVSLPEWDGRPVDVPWAVEALLSAGNRASDPSVSAETRAL